jgi:hypothetical protein
MPLKRPALLEPLLSPTACVCSQDERPRVSIHPYAGIRCVATSLCASGHGVHDAATAASAYEASRVPSVLAFVTVLHFDFIDVKPKERRNAEMGYMRQIHHLHNLWDGIRRHMRSAELHVLVSGLRNSTFEDTLTRRQMKLHTWYAPQIPTWSAAWHRSSFCKLNLWNFSFQRRSIGPVVYLDTDVVVLRSLAALFSVPTPAIVFKGSSEVLNSGLMVLHVQSQAELDSIWQTFHARVNDVSHEWRCGRMGHHYMPDGSDQQLLIHFFATTHMDVHELPASFNTFAWQLNTWQHDASNLSNVRLRGWFGDQHVSHKLLRHDAKDLGARAHPALAAYRLSISLVAS